MMHRPINRVSAVILVVAVLLISLILLAFTWPYNDFTYGTPGQLVTNEHTSTGIPVIRQGEQLIWDQPFCNKGVDTYSERWADVYADVSATGLVDLESDDQERVASFQVPSIVFYGQEPVCATSKVYSILPNYVSAGAYYRFRIDTHYHANALRTIDVHVQTERFLLLKQGDPIP